MSAVEFWFAQMLIHLVVHVTKPTGNIISLVATGDVLRSTIMKLRAETKSANDLTSAEYTKWSPKILPVVGTSLTIFVILLRTRHMDTDVQ
jgi:hypothetical protein